MKKSMTLNVILNAVRTVLSLLFPLITYPYVSRILGPLGIGQATYANSLVSYVSLVAALGIATYAVSVGSALREDDNKFKTFASTVFTLNVITCVIAYLILAIILLFIPALEAYRLLMLIYGLQIFLNTIGVEWLYTIEEKYMYITVRSIVFQILSMVCLFVFVRDKSDVAGYAFAQIVSTGGAYIPNFINAVKKGYIKLNFSDKLLTVLKPALFIFATTIATTVYVNLDTTMLGIICGDVEVGYYSSATKLYNIVKGVLNSVATVYSARLGFCFYKNKDEYNSYFKECLGTVTMMSVPMAIGGTMLARELILFLSGEEFIAATPAMRILMISLIPSTMGNIMGIGALLIVRQEKIIMYVSIVGAIFNTATNLFFIPAYGATGAAGTTLATECIVVFALIRYAMKYAGINLNFRHIANSVIASILFVPVWIVSEAVINNSTIRMVVVMVICALLYALCMIILKDDIMIMYTDKFKNKVFQTNNNR